MSPLGAAEAGAGSGAGASQAERSGGRLVQRAGRGKARTRLVCGQCGLRGLTEDAVGAARHGDTCGEQRVLERHDVGAGCTLLEPDESLGEQWGLDGRGGCRGDRRNRAEREPGDGHDAEASNAEADRAALTSVGHHGRSFCMHDEFIGPR